MKVGLQIEHVDPSRGGAETYVDRFARKLLDEGHEVHLFAAGFAHPPRGAYTHRIMERGLTRPERDLRFARAARRAAVRADLDVVVATGRTFGADVLQPHGGTLGGSRRQNVRLIRSPVQRHLKAAFDAVNPRIRMQLAIEAAQYDADPPPQVVAISRMIRRDIQQFHNVPDERLHLVYNGVDVERFSPEAARAVRDEARRNLGIDRGETCLLLVAHNFKLKGVRELVEAAERLPITGPRWRITVVGRGKERPYRRLADKLGCASRIQFAGEMDDILPAYAAADAYVQPTWYDPCSLTVLEALACGLPTVTTRFNGAGELMEGADAGTVIDAPDNTDALAAALREVLKPEVREVMAPEARRVAEAHSLRHHFEEMMAVLDHAATRKEDRS